VTGSEHANTLLDFMQADGSNDVIPLYGMTSGHFGTYLPPLKEVSRPRRQLDLGTIFCLIISLFFALVRFPVISYLLLRPLPHYARGI